MLPQSRPHPYKAWWTGSLLSIGEARAVVASQSADATLQVAGSIIAAVSWMLRDNPDQGLCVPDDLPWRDILRVMRRPYLGTMHSGPSDWDPVSRPKLDLFASFSDEANAVDPTDPLAVHQLPAALSAAFGCTGAG